MLDQRNGQANSHKWPKIRAEGQKWFLFI